MKGTIMRHINTLIHPKVSGLINPRTFNRTAARAVVINNDKILLIYTKRYDDYTLPGGGVDENEPIKEALIRELYEETGANNIEIVSEFGIYEEYRPHHFEAYDQMHMLSHIYVCSIDKELGQAKPESYEVTNGSRPVWVKLEDAINHNEAIIENAPTSMGLSVLRELELFKLIKSELVKA